MDKRAPQKILEGHSPVNKYELLALEHGSQGLTEERMVLAFQALDELVPKLGVYTRLFTKLRDDFFKAVYSDELTGVSESSEKGGEGSGYIQRLPYFVLVKRVYDDRHDLTEELKEQLEIVKERLFQKHKQYEQSQEDVARLKEHVDHLLQTQDDLQNVINSKDAEINSLETEMEGKQRDWENTQHQLDCDIADLKDSLADAKNEIEFLSQFKKGYDDMYYAFMDKQNEEEEEVKKKQKSAIATKRAYVMTDIESANHMEEQILTVMNTALEEFDKFLEGHKQELEEKVVTNEMTDAELDLQELELDEADQELEVVQHRFEQTVGSMLSELELLRKHNTMLMEQLQVLEENKPQPKKRDTGRSKGSEGKHGESILWAGLEEDEGQEEVADPFIPQERVFSKYAAMLYTSNNAGKTFEEFKDAKYCASCGEKTVICPHKMGGAEKAFVLPHNCTHIKIARPKVRINREFVQMLMKPQSPEPTFDLAPSVSSAARSYQSGMQPQDLAVSPQTATSQDSPSYGMGEAYMVHTMQRVWDDYRRRTSLERSIPRTLSLELTKSLLEQFFAYIVLQDEHTEDDSGLCSILDMLYNFMKDRYLVDDMMYLAAHDFLTSIIEYSGTNKMVQLLGHVLVGNLDASCLRYVLMMADFIDLVDWVEVEDFRAFASVVYPFLTEDDLESLQMSYTSFSENRISKRLVCDFLIHIILKYREPRFHDLENKLVPFQSSESGQLTDKEHKDALDNILPLCNERVRRRLFIEAEKAVMLDGVLNAVPIMRLAQISGYLALQQITTIIKENINHRIAEWRDRPSSAGSARQTMEFHHAIDAAGEQKLLTLSKVKTLASNMARTAKHREDRQNQSYDDDGYEDHEEDEGW